MKSVLVLRGGALGDFILTLPIIRALGREFSSVNFVANRRFAEFGGDARFALDDLDLAPFFSVNAELPSRWRDQFRSHDLVLSYLHDPEGIFERNVRACGVKSFVVGPHRFEAGAHATEQLARPLARLGIALTEFAPSVELNDEERRIARAQSEQPLFALHPGSGSPGKNWPIQNWMALIEELLASGQQIIIVGGEADEKEIERVRARFADDVRYVENWPLRRLAALLSSTRFVGHDSGVSHLAAAAGARCILLFGASDPAVWAPRNEAVRVLLAPEKDLRRLTLAHARDALGF